MKKLLSILLTITLIICTLPVFSLTASAESYSGMCGNNLTYSFDSTTGVLEIKGRGDMKHYFTASESPWYSYRTSIKSLKFSEGISDIGVYAFYGCTSIKEVTIPNSVNSINHYAFYGCTGLTSVTMSDNVRRIYDSAFKNCTALTSITLSKSLTRIDDSVFQNCSGLSSITIPSSVTEICDASFSGCSSLRGVSLPTALNSLGSSAFSGCISLTSISLPNNLKVIEDSTFYGCSNLKSVSIPNDVTSIGDRAFLGCTKLSKITLPDSLSYLGVGAFSECTTLKEVVIPEMITTICDSLFSGCTALTAVTIPDSVNSIKEDAFNGCTALTAVTIPDSVNSIKEDAFNGCSALEKIVIPFGVTSISETSFLNCSSLVEIVVEENNTVYHSDSNCVINTSTGTLLLGCKTSVIPTDGSVTVIGNYAFKNCTDMNELHLSSSITKIGEQSFFNCSGLNKIYVDENNAVYRSENNCLIDTGNTEIILGSNTSVIPSDGSVTSIADYSFYGCTGLTYITIPAGIESIGMQAFFGCINLKTVNNHSKLSITKGSTDYGCVGYYADVVDWIPNDNGTCGDSISYTFNGETGLLKIEGSGHLNKRPWSDYRSYIKSVELSEGITGIGDNVFYKHENLISVNIPDSVTYIGSSAFYGCTSLTEIVVPDSVTSIKDSAFGGCSSLESITIPYVRFYDRVGSRSCVLPFGYIFGKEDYTGGTRTEQNYYDSVLDRLVTVYYYIPTTLKTVIVTGGNLSDYGAFKNCSNIVEIALPDTVTVIGEYTFSGCRSLKSIIIPTSVTNIGYNAFYGCTAITSVTIPNSVTSVGSYAFYGCTAITSVIIPNSVTSIGSCAFYGCTGLTEVVIPDSITKISYGMFYSCTALSDVTIPSSITTIGSYAFYECSALSSVTIPAGVTDIGDNAFEYCENLKTVNNFSSLHISKGVYSDYGYVGYYANTVNWNGVYTGTCGEGVTYTFNGSTGALKIEGTGKMGYWSNPPWYEYSSKVLSLEVEKGVTYLEDSAFKDCYNLTEVTIADSINEIGQEAFSGCKNLKRVYISNITAWLNIQFYYYSNPLSNGAALYLNNELVTELVVPDGITKIKNFAFNGCSGLVSVSFPGSVTDVCSEAFADCKELSVVHLNEGIKNIRGSAFYNCTDLAEINIPSSVAVVDYSAFLDCKNLKKVYIDDINAWLKISFLSSCSNPLNNGADLYLDNRIFTELIIPQGTSNIMDYAFYGCNSLREIYIPSSVLNIDNSAFYYCNNLTAINVSEINAVYHSKGNCLIETETGLLMLGCGTSVIPNDGSVTKIGNSAFLGKTDLKEITIPNTVLSIGNSAFNGCTGLTTLIIPESVTTIGSYAFDGCRGLREVSIPKSVTNIGSYAFDLCNIEYVYISDITAWLNIDFEDYDANPLQSGGQLYLNNQALVELVVPDGVTEIKDYAFYRCSGILSVTIPTTVKSIGKYAFYDCSISELNLSEGITTIRDSAFTYCSFLDRVFIPKSVTDIKSNSFQYTSITIIGYQNSYAETYAANRNISFGKIIALNDTVYYYIANNALYIDGIGGLSDYSQNDAVPWYSEAENIKKVVIGEDITAVGTFSFDCLTNLEKIIVYGKDLTFGQYAINENANVTVYGYKGSTVETYCTNNSLIFKAWPNIVLADNSTGNSVSFKFENNVLYSIDGNNWNTTTVFTDLTPVTEYTLYARLKNTGYYSDYDSDIHNHYVTYTFTTPKLTLEPTAPTVESFENGVITLKKQDYFEYSLDGINWQTSNVFNDIVQTEKKYTFYQRVAESENSNQSDKSSPVTFVLLNAPILESKTDTSVTLKAVDNYEYSLDGHTWQASNVFDNLNSETSYSFYCRILKTETNDIFTISTALNVITNKSYILGDINSDNEINTTDLSVIKLYLAGAYSGTITTVAADINMDNAIDTTDLAELKLMLAGATE